MLGSESSIPTDRIQRTLACEVQSHDLSHFNSCLNSSCGEYSVSQLLTVFKQMVIPGAELKSRSPGFCSLFLVLSPSDVRTNPISLSRLLFPQNATGQA